MAGVAILASHVSLGWLTQARRKASLTLGWRAQLLAAATIGTGTCATAVLGLTNEVVKFPMGFGSVASTVLWLGAIILSLPLMALLSNSRRWWVVAIGAALLTGTVLGTQVGWVWAAGFRPGVRWDKMILLIAAALMLPGFGCALWMAVSQSRSTRSSEPQGFLRFGSAALLGLALVVGQQVVLGAADLPRQLGSVYRNQVPSSLLSLACGALVPLTLAVMALDLSIRRHRRSQGRSFSPYKRSKRRHRVRSL